MNGNFGIKCNDYESSYLYETNRLENKETISIQYKNYNIVSEYEDKLIQTYFIEKMLCNCENVKMNDLLSLEGPDLKILDKIFSIENRIKSQKYDQKTREANANKHTKEVFIDIEEDLYVLIENNKIVNSQIVGNVILKKGIEDGMVVGIERRNRIDDISGHLVDVNRLDVKVKDNIFMTYSRKNNYFDLPIIVNYTENQISIKKHTNSIVKNILIKIPIYKYCFKVESRVDLGIITIKESKNNEERYIFWNIKVLDEENPEKKFHLNLCKYYLPENKGKENRSIHVSFEIDSYLDSAIEIKGVKRANGNKCITFVSSKLIPVEYEIRI